MAAVTLILPADIARQIEGEGEKAFPNECCGILVGRELSPTRRIAERIVPMQNVFDETERYHRFTIDPLAQIAAEKQASAEGRLVLGYYHSHPDSPARPSEYDRQHMPPWSFYSQLIVSVMQRRAAEMAAWQINDETEQFEPQDLQVATPDGAPAP